MRVSIVIPAHNAESYLGAAIESAVAQPIVDWGLVVVDDGSSDDTASVAHRYAARDPRLRIVRQANAGVALPRNRGFVETAASCPYVIFLSSGSPSGR